jgi:Aminotransferase class-III
MPARRREPLAREEPAELQAAVTNGSDEVAWGFGRTSRLFACEHFDLDPDMLNIAKA